MSPSSLDSYRDHMDLIPFTKEVFFVKASGTNEQGALIEPAPANKVGFYDTNNGVLAFVDENRDYWICPLPNPDAVRVLREAGYRAGSIRVPHSNDRGFWIRSHYSPDQSPPS